MDAIRDISAESVVIEFSEINEILMAARSNRHFTVFVGAGAISDILTKAGTEVSNLIGLIVLGPVDEAGLSKASIRSGGAMSIIESPDRESLVRVARRALEFRALRALEFCHRCESQRLMRREAELLGQTPETMTDDLLSVQPPPLPVGAISPYRLEEATESFEKAYIERVLHLCASSREAASYLDVSSATLARKQRRDDEEEAS
ncbi:MAG: hypothetical protein VYC39_20600 [Myxococcota bacterium]|nr:hypothetical protein [Myxococcota bacterium]